MFHHPTATSTYRMFTATILPVSKRPESWMGLSVGPDQFCPSEPLSRRTFAVWMVGVLDGDQAPDFVDPNAVGTSRFADVEASEPESLFIERLSDLRVTAGCASKPWRYCPDTNVSRAQMASFLARAFGLGGADDAGFIDVSEDSTHYDTINMLAASGITTGCSSTPKRYCPGQATTRAQMASFLARAIEWRNPRNLVEPEPEEPEPVEPINVTATDDSVQLEVSYDESAHQARISWRPTSNNPTQVTHYIVQWRPYWDGFTDGLQQRVELSDLRNGQFLVLINPTQNIYGVRVITVGSAGSHLATSEVKVPSNSNKLRDLIKEKIIDPHQGDWPWLRDTWKHMSGPEFGFGVDNYSGAATVYRDGQSADRNSLERKIAKSDSRSIPLGPGPFRRWQLEIDHDPRAGPCLHTHQRYKRPFTVPGGRFSLLSPDLRQSWARWRRLNLMRWT